MPDPNNVVSERIVYMGVCKAANTSIKTALLEGREADPHRAFRSCSAVEALELRGLGYRVFSVVRNPIARLRSCWADKVVGGFRPFLRDHGIEACGFDEFVARVADIPDCEANQHFRSMAFDLCVGDEVVPRWWRLEDDPWRQVSKYIRINLDVQRLNVSTDVPAVSQATERLIRKRYARDFRLFYDAS